LRGRIAGMLFTLGAILIIGVRMFREPGRNSVRPPAILNTEKFRTRKGTGRAGFGGFNGEGHEDAADRMTSGFLWEADTAN
jgi:hypothetical protein